MKLLQRTTVLAAAALAVLATSSCSSTRYGDAKAVETVTVDWGSTDLQTLAGGMSDSLVDEPNLQYLDHSGKGDDKRVIVYFGGIENRTSEHIDTIAIRDAIQSTLFDSRKFRFVADTAGQDEIGDQVRFQQGSGRVDVDQAKAFGKQLGADVIVYGRLFSIDKRKGASVESLGTRTQDVYYQFSLQCVNIETSEVLWTETKDIRKTKRTGLFGS
ncbi:MAG: penicillin-binding protein activator LpoB [Planctomycetota bacterium]